MRSSAAAGQQMERDVEDSHRAIGKRHKEQARDALCFSVDDRNPTISIIRLGGRVTVTAGHSYL